MFREWLAGNVSEQELTEQFEILSVDFPQNAVLAAIGTIGNIPESAEENTLTDDIARYTLEEAAEKIMQIYGDGYVFTDKYQYTMILIRLTNPVETAETFTLACGTEFPRITGVKCTAIAAPCRRDNFVEVHEELCHKMHEEAGCRVTVRSAREYIMKAYGNSELNLPMVAEAIGINPSYLSHLMKEYLGMPFQTFLTNCRIQAACEMMRDESVSINQIAELTGYKNQHYFSSVFKNVKGISPSEYRKELWGSHEKI